MQPGLVWIYVHRLLPSGNARQGKSQSMYVYCRWCHSDQVCSVISDGEPHQRPSRSPKFRCPPGCCYRGSRQCHGQLATVGFHSYVTSEPMLEGREYRMGVKMVSDMVADHVLHDLRRNTGKANRPVVPSVPFRPLLEDGVDPLLAPDWWDLTWWQRLVEEVGKKGREFWCKLFQQSASYFVRTTGFRGVDVRQCSTFGHWYSSREVGGCWGIWGHPSCGPCWGSYYPA